MALPLTPAPAWGPTTGIPVVLDATRDQSAHPRQPGQSAEPKPERGHRRRGAPQSRAPRRPRPALRAAPALSARAGAAPRFQGPSCRAEPAHVGGRILSWHGRFTVHHRKIDDGGSFTVNSGNRSSVTDGAAEIRSGGRPHLF